MSFLRRFYYRHFLELTPSFTCFHIDQIALHVVVVECNHSIIKMILVINWEILISFLCSWEKKGFCWEKNCFIAFPIFQCSTTLSTGLTGSFVQNDKCIRLAFSRCFNLPRLDFYRIWLGRKMEFLLLQNTIITSTYNLKRFKSNMLNK